MSRRIVLGPFNRVEGDLEVSLEVAGGRVAAAYVNSPLFRGFEQILRGKDPRDALVLVPRICGICSVSQSAAAAAALREAMGLAVPENGELAANLVLAAENLADHFTHFYLFFMPDFARDEYAGRPWFDAARARFKAVRGTAAAEALPARTAFLQLTGILAGKWPHTLSLQPGGSSRAVSAVEKIRLHGLLREFRRWLERHLFGDALEAVAALDSADALAAWAAARAPTSSDLRLFLEIAADLELARLGRATDRFLSYGAYPLAGTPLFARGLWQPEDGATALFDPADIREDLSHAWLQGDTRHPWRGLTEPDADKAGAYTWCKAPRLAGQVVECGALARQMVDGHPLAHDLVARDGGSVLARVLCRLLELTRVLPAMEAWVQALTPGEPFCAHGALPDEGAGCGLVEAARGGLGHWLTIRHGRIAGYQIIAPTTWNFSPRDAAGTPGALEQALAGLPMDDARKSLVVQHVVRSFDPCMVCTVH
ncbi:nickel-dependent hydrogenase large subunit [Pseudothauera rhizosphaerae]|uniref:HupV protein n=1 Tax=Pseudothauera rhizosphaerae TaxID=2565932 RepID=A0A4S4AYV3_9RHOO|nr:nickel-dependent hydrogenase large subunit [Pseudothauera rhizosphaerae]THF65347.1 HupV protein [Pseudothauera rhizosphaerae]